MCTPEPTFTSLPVLPNSVVCSFGNTAGPECAHQAQAYTLTVAAQGRELDSEENGASKVSKPGVSKAARHLVPGPDPTQAGRSLMGRMRSAGGGWGRGTRASPDLGSASALLRMRSETVTPPASPAARSLTPQAPQEGEAAALAQETT